MPANKAIAAFYMLGFAHSQISSEIFLRVCNLVEVSQCECGNWTDRQINKRFIPNMDVFNCPKNVVVHQLLSYVLCL